MQCNFSVGDVVVCVDDEPLKELPPKPGYGWIVRGRLYRVSEIGVDKQGKAGIKVAGLVYGPDQLGFLAWRFRKVQPADQSFTDFLKTMKATFKVDELV